MAILKITTVNTTKRSTCQQAYIMEAGDQLYLRHQALRDLGCLTENYPEAEVTSEEGNLGQITEVEEERPCNFLNRALPPDPPKEMPYEGIEENVDKLKKWLINYSKAPAFNMCTFQKLTLISSSPPLQLCANLQPMVWHKPEIIPLHLQAEVKAGPPFLQASSIPVKSSKTCLDAKEGYHSIPIHENDQKHTAFLTMWGRYESAME